MEQTKNLCAKIPIELHKKISVEKDKKELNLNQYITEIIEEYYKLKEMKLNMVKTKTLAFQISSELNARIKKHIENTPNLTQKAFITEIIIKALDEIEKTN